jgi:hypothetical protein
VHPSSPVLSTAYQSVFNALRIDHTSQYTRDWWESPRMPDIVLNTTHQAICKHRPISSNPILIFHVAPPSNLFQPGEPKVSHGLSPYPSQTHLPLLEITGVLYQTSRSDSITNEHPCPMPTSITKCHPQSSKRMIHLVRFISATCFIYLSQHQTLLVSRITACFILL